MIGVLISFVFHSHGDCKTSVVFEEQHAGYTAE